MSLADQVVLVTGAAGNLGSAIARAAAARGAKIVLADMRRDPLVAVAGEISGESLIVDGADVRIAEAISEENKSLGITANCVAPGTIDTPQNRAAMPDADHAVWVKPEDLAEVFAFLLSPAARAVTGATIPVFGKG